MLYIILSIVLIVASYLVVYYLTKGDDDSASGFAIIVLMLVGVAPIINTFVTVQTPVEYQEMECTITGLELVDSEISKLKGTFILGTGTISGNKSSDLKYVFFANTPYGKQMRTTNTNNLYLRETDDEEPKLINIKTKQVKRMSWIDRLWGHKEDEISINEIVKGQILVVPTNTIKIEYNVDI